MSTGRYITKLKRSVLFPCGRTASAKRRNPYSTSSGRIQENRSSVRLRLMWEDNIKTDLPEIVCEEMDWTELAPDSVR